MAINISPKAMIASTTYGKDGEYWREKFSGDLIKSTFPYVHSGAGGIRKERLFVKFEIQRELSSKLVELSKGLDHRLYIFLTAALVALLHKYTGNGDIIIGSPIFKQDQEGDFINTILALRHQFEGEMTFRELLLECVRKTVAEASEHQNYPLEALLYHLEMPFSQEKEFPLFDVAILLENIHEEKYIQDIYPKFLFSFVRHNGGIGGEVEYNSLFYDRDMVKRIVLHFERVLKEVAFKIDIPLADIDILDEKDKKQLLLDFNDTVKGDASGKNIIDLFEEQVLRTPDQIAVSSPVILDDVYEDLKSEKVSINLLEKIAMCCFRKKPLIFSSELKFSDPSGSEVKYNLIKTVQHNCLVVNDNTVTLLDLLDGKHPLASVYRGIKNFEVAAVVYPIPYYDLLEISCNFDKEAEEIRLNTFENWVRLIKILYKNNLIELVNIERKRTAIKKLSRECFSYDESPTVDTSINDFLIRDRELSKADVLLMGGTTGTPTTGLLYLASYLRRKGIKTCCQFNDTALDYPSMKKNIEVLLDEIQPRIVAVSLKWSQYIVRVIDMCQIVKKYAADHELDIKVVIGGNTASYYWREMMQMDCIDYLIRGDGEEPLLRLCRGETDIPNLVFRRNGEVVENSIWYIQDTANSKDIYLSHLEEILISRFSAAFGVFFIFTHKGCTMNCIFCGGCNQAQQKTFNRKDVFIRGVDEVRKDIIEAKKFASTFLFDFHNSNDNLFDYCSDIWQGIDLSSHFCVFKNIVPPSTKLIELLNKTFKYVYWEIDVYSFSAPHRERLISQKLVKPLPTDDEIMSLLAECEKYANNEVRMNLITGMPYLTQVDVEVGKKMLDKIMSTSSCFGELHLARLHAQPGAPIIENAESFGMHSYAVTFEDFQKYSQRNYSKDSAYPDIESYTYPYIYFNDDDLNSKATQLYSEANLKVGEYQRAKRRDLIVSESLSYLELNTKANQLTALIREKGVGTGDIVGIMLEPSIEISTTILAVLKAGAVYLPIDPEFPGKRAFSMLKDSRASVLLTKGSFTNKLSFKPLRSNRFKEKTIYITPSRPQITELDHLPFPDRSLVDYEKYNRYIGHAMVKNCLSIQATRGCPYKCAYCHKIWPKRNVVRSAAHLFKEVQLCYNLGVRRFAFTDDIFNLNAKNSRKFFELVIDQGLDIQFFFPNGMRADLLTREYIDTMVEAGLTSIGLALETASPRLQRLIGKNLDLHKLRANIDYFCEKYPQIILELFTMHGFPTETEEEAMQTLDFIKSIKWIHFPVVSILKIYPNTDMEKLALESGISVESLERSDHLAGHELPDTLPFDKNFTLNYQADYFNEYFLLKKRFLDVLPQQLKVLSEDELVQKYNSYLPVEVNSLNDLLDFVGIDKNELGLEDLSGADDRFVPDLNEKLKRTFPHEEASPEALRILLLDLSKYFSGKNKMLYDVVDAPLGLMCLLTYLKRQLGALVKGKIAKSRIDFNDYEKLKKIIDEFKPDVIGIRTLNFFKNFFHKTVALIRQWGIHVPIIVGGPYGTTSYDTLLHDLNVDLAVLGEGEITFCELISKMIANDRRLPDEEILKKIPGIVFIPTGKKSSETYNFEEILLDEQPEGVSKEIEPVMESKGQRSDIVYTVFTSGSTGRPRGVMITNDNLVNYVDWFSTNTGLSERDRGLLMSSFAFDLGNTVLFSSLLTGGELHIIPRSMYLEVNELLRYIKQKDITYMKMTPSHLSMVMSNPDASTVECEKLRLVVLGGEAINVKDVEKMHGRWSGIEVMNHYGPTEATIGSVAQFVDFQRFDEYRMNPVIGRPIDNCRAYILDEELRLLPVGVPGELCLSGRCLARGYINSPEMTAEKFVKNPFNGHRMYRTGDLARWRSEGQIEFLGRKDSQVKIRGYRVELKEIEELLLRHDQVEEAYIMERKSHDDDRYLCAYIVPRQGKPSKEKVSLKQKEIIKRDASYRDIVSFRTENSDYSIVDCFMEQVNQFRHQVAVESADESLAYSSLNETANQIAHLILSHHGSKFNLSSDERTRYQRQMILDGWGIESQERLKETTAFVAGAGGGASSTITQLALAGFGNIIVCDYDKVELSNLNRQFLHDESRIGMNKALSARMTVKRLNPHVNVIPVTEKLTRDNVYDLVGDAEIIFDMFDGLTEKFMLAECAATKGIPHMIAAMVDRSAYAAIFSPPKTPCFYCLFDHARLEALISGMKQTFDHYQKNPLAVAATSLFVSTGFAVNEAIKILLNFPNPAYNKFFLFNQAGSEKIRDSHGYRAMTFTFSDHFRNVCKQQGFDWEVGWRGKFLEELDIIPDPGCPLCGKRRKEKSWASVHPLEMKQTRQNIALLVSDRNVYRAAAVMGILKAGKTCIPLDPGQTIERLAEIVTESGSAFILTDNENKTMAEDLKGRINDNVLVFNLEDLKEDEKPELPDPGVVVEGERTAFIFYTGDTSSDRQWEKKTHSDILLDLQRVGSLPSNPDLKTGMLNLLGMVLDHHVSPDSGIKTEQHIQLNSTLRDYLLVELPDYMVPNHFIRIDRIPLTPNGKIDRSALPEAGEVDDEDKYIPPADVIEERLVEVWSEVLDIDKNRISIDDNFFELGGHSLKVTKMISLLREMLNIKLPLTEVFRTPTIRALRKYIGTMEDSAGLTIKKDENVVLLRRGKFDEKNLFFIHDGSGEVQAYMELCNLLSADINYWGIRADIGNGSEPVQLSIEQLAGSYVKKMKKVQVHGPYNIAGWSLGGVIAFEMARQLEAANDDVGLLAVIDSVFPKAGESNGNDDIENIFNFLRNWLKNYLPLGKDEAIFEDFDASGNLKKIGSLLEKNLEGGEIEIGLLREFLPRGLAWGFLKNDRLNIKETMNYINLMVTFYNTLADYVPGNKIKTRVHYFYATRNPGKPELNLENYSHNKIELYPLDGDHFSIFEQPYIESFSKKFAEIMEMNRWE